MQRIPEVDFEAAAMRRVGVLVLLLLVAWTVACAPPAMALAFHDQRRASGHAGCRDFLALYEGADGNLAFHYMAMLGALCPSDALLEQMVLPSPSTRSPSPRWPVSSPRASWIRRAAILNSCRV